jgi:hypothetical protein
VSLASACCSASLVTPSRPRPPHGSQTMASGPRTSDRVSAPSRGNEAEFHGLIEHPVNRPQTITACERLSSALAAFNRRRWVSLEPC